MPPHEFVRAVRTYCEEHELLATGDRVVIGVSGGPDSMALLWALHELSGPWRLNLHVAHLDHGLRPGSARDAAFVATAAGRLGLPVTLAHERVARFARQRRLSVEEAGRVARYGFLTRLAVKHKAGRIAVGHHADDQAETVLMRLIRGAAAGGLSVIPPQRRLTERVRLVRPLLGVSRADIERYAAWRRVAVRRDPTNASREHLRNRIRHDLLPLLARRYNPGIREALRGAAQVLAEEHHLLETQAVAAFGRIARRAGTTVRIGRNGLLAVPLPLRRRVLRQAALGAGADPRRLTQAHLGALIRLTATGTGSVDLPAARATCVRSVLRISRVS